MDVNAAKQVDVKGRKNKGSNDYSTGAREFTGCGGLARSRCVDLSRKSPCLPGRSTPPHVLPPACRKQARINGETALIAHTDTHARTLTGRGRCHRRTDALKGPRVAPLSRRAPSILVHPTYHTSFASRVQGFRSGGGIERKSPEFEQLGSGARFGCRVGRLVVERRGVISG